MKVCIYGLGAVGGLLGARIARSGQPVGAVARGDTLAAVRLDGLRLVERTPDGECTHVVPVVASDRPADLGVQDLVILTVKTTALAAVATEIAPLLGPRTTVLSAMNGVPWWFFHGLGGRVAGLRLASVDADGAIARAIPPACVLGAVTHLSSAVVSPGVVRHGFGERLIVGEPSGGASARCDAVAALLARAGFQVEVAPQIQQEIWLKLWGNMTMNPVSAITGATADRILDDPLVREFMSAAMREAARIGEAIGLAVGMTPDERHAVTRQLGAFRTSMLQDVQGGRPIELDALVGAVAEMGRQAGVPTPSIDALFGLARLFGRTRGLYPEGDA